MKSISGTVLLGLILTLAVVYWLQPLNSGAVALVAALCMGLAAVLVGGVRKVIKRKKE